MAAHPTWKGFLKLSLVTFPVKAYTVVSESEKIHFNQLHAECHSRIQYKKTCPIHGEVLNAEIVSGYEYSKGQYVIVDTSELDKLRTEDDFLRRLGRTAEAAASYQEALTHPCSEPERRFLLRRIDGLKTDALACNPTSYHAIGKEEP